MVAAFVLLTALVASSWSPLGSLDQRILSWGYGLTYGHRGRSAWWNDVARYGQPMVWRVLLLALGLAQIRWRRRALGAWLIGIALAETAVGPLMKYLLNRPRPHWLHPIAVEHTTSYPSGHATAIAMFATASILLALATLGSRPGRWAAIAVTLMLGTVVSMDRIFLGVHYGSDVLGGILLGSSVTFAGWVLMLHVLRRRSTDS
ncbi:MAG: phosphatase PAP2 family protein [Nocardioides sp.]